jgi:hypothetical protein
MSGSRANRTAAMIEAAITSVEANPSCFLRENRIYDFAEEFGGVDRLGENLKGVTLRCALPEQSGCIRHSRKQQDLAEWQQFAHLNGKIDPRELGHYDIGKEEVGLAGLSGLQSLKREVKRNGVEPCLIENRS